MTIKELPVTKKEIGNIYRGHYPGKVFRCRYYDHEINYTFSYYFKTIEKLNCFFELNKNKYKIIQNQKRISGEWMKI